jgi:hypothetical protein
MFRVALGLSILLAAVFPLGQYLLGWFTTTQDLRSQLGPWALIGLVLFVKYFLVAAVLYIVFRLVRLDQRLNLKGKGSTRVLVANCVVVAYAIFLMLARMVEGGGFGYLVAQLSLFFLWPSWAVILWGMILIWMTKREGAAPDTSLERTRER